MDSREELSVLPQVSSTSLSEPEGALPISDSPRSVLDVQFTGVSADERSSKMAGPGSTPYKKLFRGWSFGAVIGAARSAESSPCDSPRRPVMSKLSKAWDTASDRSSGLSEESISKHQSGKAPTCGEISGSSGNIGQDLKERLEASLAANDGKEQASGNGVPLFLEKQGVESAGQAEAGTGQSEPNIVLIVSLLSTTSSDEKGRAAASIRSMARTSVSKRVALGKAGAIPPLVQALQCGEDFVLEQALSALCNLAIGNQTNKNAIVASGAIPRLVELLRWHSQEVREAAAAVILTLAAETAHKAPLGAAGAIPALVDLIQSGSSRGIADAVHALANLAGCEANRSTLLADQPFAVLLAAVVRDPASRTAERAIALLATLAGSDGPGRVALSKPNGVAMLLVILERGTSQGQETAVSALLNLCAESKRCRHLAVEGGAPANLMRLMERGSPPFRLRLRMLLRCLEKPGSAPILLSGNSDEASPLQHLPGATPATSSPLPECGGEPWQSQLNGAEMVEGEVKCAGLEEFKCRDVGLRKQGNIVQQMAMQSSREAMAQLLRRAGLS